MIGGMFKAVAVFIGIAVGLLIVAMIVTITTAVACGKWAVDEYKRRANAQVTR